MIAINFKLQMQLCFVIIPHLDEKEDEKWVHVIHTWWHPMIDDNSIIFSAIIIFLLTIHGVLSNLYCNYIS